MSYPIRVVVADSHHLILTAINQQLAEVSDIEVVAVCTTAACLEPLLEYHEPNVLLFDPRLPTTLDRDHYVQPIPTVVTWQQQYPNTAFLVLSQFGDPATVRSMVRAGVKGYCLKEDKLSLDLAPAIRRVARGLSYYSPTIMEWVTDGQAPASILSLREREVLQAVAMTPDATAAALGQQLGISGHTVSNHLNSIYQKLGVSSRAGAVLTALQGGLISPLDLK